jgi:riboflavin synthase alpha subunit
VFTGIVAKTGRIVRPGRRLEVETGWRDLREGESISISGVCLTVARIEGSVAGFDVHAETARKTTLPRLKKGDAVNLERALRAGDRLGGHVVQGHVDGVGSVLRTGAWLEVETPLAKQLVPKGSVTVDGVSLTVAELEADRFTIALIPHTRRITTLGRLKKGARVNVETDHLAKGPRGPGLTKALLEKAGFLA